jgi:hypothetical protein
MKPIHQSGPFTRDDERLSKYYIIPSCQSYCSNSSKFALDLIVRHTWVAKMAYMKKAMVVLLVNLWTKASSCQTLCSQKTYWLGHGKDGVMVHVHTIYFLEVLSLESFSHSLGGVWN